MASGWLRMVIVRNLACFRRGLCWDLRQTLDVRPKQRVPSPPLLIFAGGIGVSTKVVKGRFDQCGELGDRKVFLLGYRSREGLG